MKKFILSLGLIATAFGLTNCTKNEEFAPVVETKGDFAIYASTETRTANDGLNTVWSAKDEINVFHAIGGTTGYVNDTPYTNSVAYPFVCEDATAGRFLGSLAGTLDVEEEYDWYAFYPYSSYIKTPANNSAGYTYVGSKAGEAQVQNGNNSMAHIAGANYPMAGYAVAVPGDSAPHLTFNHISSLIEVEVANKLAEAITISEIQFIAEEDIVGSYYINFASKEALNFTPSGANYVSNTALLTVKGGAEIAAGTSAKFYMAVKPFIAKAGTDLTIKVSASSANGLGAHEKDITLTNDVTFSAGKIKNVKVNYNAELVETIKPSELAYQLVTDVNDLQVGDYVIIAAKSANYALSTDQKTNNRGQCAITKTGDYAIVGDDVQYLTLEEGTVDGTFAFYTGSGYLYAASSSENHLKTQTKNDDNGSWTITISNGTASVVAKGSNTRNVMQYNGTSSLFACYSSASQSGIALYKGVDASNIVSKKLSSPEFDEDNFALNAKYIKLVWNNVANAQKYAVSCDNNVQKETGVNNIIFDELNPDTDYTFTLTAIGDGVFYTDSDSVSITVSTKSASESVEEVSATLTFDDKTKRTTFNNSQQVWAENGITFTNDKAASTSNVGDYAKPARLYASSKVTVAAPGNITKIVFDCNSSSYATAMKNSIGSTATASSDKVTVVLDGANDSFVVAKLTAQVRIDAVTVTYQE